MQLAPLIADYGYLAVFVGSLLEGETILVLAGFAAHQGELSLPVVIAIAFVGGTLGDQVLFFVGHRYGAGLVARLPHGPERAQRVAGWIHRFQAPVIIGVRFMYGLRLIGPIIIGASGVAPWRFVVFNLIGAAVWAPLVAGAGYLFGHAMQWLLADFAHYEELGLVLIVALAIVFGLARRLLARRHDDAA